ncbi:hypothetical protein FBQ97_03990 [Acidobacteria bacterium ACD]|nr:MAG: hypothetical protein EDX89_10365 [Acidobacteriota bacterium]MCE7957556.1 hypothetical protein [Acidobacteria bacterium ACB2]MDL1948958.1 hypothetical protein [Acidobacteria bacterium ACD]
MVIEKKTTDVEAPPKVSIEEAWARLQEEWRKREAEDRSLLDDLRERHRIVPSAPAPGKKT